MKTATKYERGDRVVSTASWHGKTAGTVASAGRGASVMVRWDGGNKDERVFMDGLRPETAEDVAKREHEAALRAWRDCRPPTEIARVELDSRWGSSDEVGATASAKTPDEMRQAATAWCSCCEREVALLRNGCLSHHGPNPNRTCVR